VSAGGKDLAYGIIEIKGNNWQRENQTKYILGTLYPNSLNVKSESGAVGKKKPGAETLTNSMFLSKETQKAAVVGEGWGWDRISRDLGPPGQDEGKGENGSVSLS